MGRWLANVLRLGRKEIASLASDKVLALFVIYSFSFAIYSEATGVKTEVANAPVAIVDADRSPLSARIQDGLLRPYFRRPALVDRAEVDPAMDRGAYCSCSRCRPISRPTCCAGARRPCRSTSTRPP
jgi:ABC-2 type transport system permease protein